MESYWWILVYELTYCDVQQASCIGEAGYEQETNCLVINYDLAFKKEAKIPVVHHALVLV